MDPHAGRRVGLRDLAQPLTESRARVGARGLHRSVARTCRRRPSSEETRRERGPCPLAGKCILKVALDGAERVFIDELNRFTLADVVVRKTGVALRGLIAARG